MKWPAGFTADEIEESADEVVIRENSVADLPSEADVLQVCLPAKVAYFLMHQMKLSAPFRLRSSKTRSIWKFWDAISNKPVPQGR